jgi:prepilin-type N-terminal cleavage/methylation domain-containing protein
MARLRSGFTLIELLVVIVILLTLIALLLPALSGSRTSANLLRDQSQIRQLLAACATYASNNKGRWPIGARELLPGQPAYDDDVRWIAPKAFAAFLAFTGNSKAAADWLDGNDAFPLGKPLDGRQQVVLSCTSMATNETTMRTEVGRLDRRSGPGFRGTMLGYNYWGNRNLAMQTDVFDRNGLSTGKSYRFPSRHGDRPTTGVLISCPNYVGPTYGIQLPHVGRSDGFTFTWTADPSVTSPTSPVTRQTRGMHFGYTDGRVEWVDRGSLASVRQNGFGWVYFDGSSR